MSAYNKTDVHPSAFILIGIPGLEATHIWISIPFCMVDLLDLLGNFSLLFIITIDPRLYDSMYLFLCRLAVADLIVCATSVPKFLSFFWFRDGEIYFEVCLIQVFLILYCSTVESGFFLAMAFDRYVAICNPLRHSAVLTHSVTGSLGLAIVFRGTALLSPHPFLLRWLAYCRTNIISHTYCEFMALIQIACAETRICRAYRLIVGFLKGGVDFILIICSYALMLHTVFHPPSEDVQLKTLDTCGSHLCIILMSYTPAFSFLTHRFGHHVAPHAYIFVVKIYALVPPMVKTIIYGVKTKRIYNRFLKVFSFSKP
uniref:G-protein coupled receptors family 1 profile domain-containing protein n=1 Tax=Equus caballus TaxID=9796 RepID=F6Z1Z2_HORSE